MSKLSERIEKLEYRIATQRMKIAKQERLIYEYRVRAKPAPWFYISNLTTYKEKLLKLQIELAELKKPVFDSYTDELKKHL